MTDGLKDYPKSSHYANILLNRKEQIVNNENINPILKSLPESPTSSHEQHTHDTIRKHLLAFCEDLISGKVLKIIENAEKPRSKKEKFNVYLDLIDALEVFSYRKCIFLNFLPSLTSSPTEIIQITQEVERLGFTLHKYVFDIKHKLNNDTIKKTSFTKGNENIEDARESFKDRPFIPLKLKEVANESVLGNSLTKGELNNNDDSMNFIRNYENKDGGLESERQKELNEKLAEVSRLSKELEESKTFIEKITEHTPNVVYLYDFVEEKIIYTNKDIFTLLGYSKDQQHSLDNIEGFFHHEDRKKRFDYYEELKLAEDKEVKVVEVRLKNARNEWQYFILRGTVFKRDEKQNARQFLAIAQDVTQIKVSEEALKTKIDQLKKANLVLEENKYFIDRVMDSSPGGIYIFDLRKSRIVFSNEALFSVLGYSEEYYQNLTSDLIHPDDYERRNAFYSGFRNAEEGEIREIELRLKNFQGYYMYFLVRATIFKRDKKGETVQIIGISQDITKIKKTEDLLRKTIYQLQETNEELTRTEELLKELNNELEERVEKRTEELKESIDRFELVSQTTNEVIWDKLFNEKEIKINQAFEKTFGLLSEDEVFSMDSWSGRVHPEDRKSAIKSRLDAVEQKKEGWFTEYRFLKSDKTYAYVLDRGKIIYNDSGECHRIVGSIMDVTRQKEAELALYNHQKFLKMALKASNTLIWNRNLSSNQLTVSDDDYELYFRRTGIKYSHSDQVAQHFHPKDLIGYRKATTQAIKNKKPFVFQFRIIHPGTSEIFWFEDNGNVILNEKGIVVSIGGIITDITDRKINEQKIVELNLQLQAKNYEYQTAEEELKASNEDLHNTVNELDERNYELDQFVYKISHDLRSPLTSILGLIELAKSEESILALKEYLEMIEGRVNKLDHFIKSMLEYSRNNRTESTADPIEFEKLVKETTEQLEYLKNFSDLDIHLNTEYQAKFTGDQLRMKIIFSNLISNAIKYQDTRKSARFLRIIAKVTSSETEIIFTDNGIGIKEEYLNKIFDMFFRASSASEGSGLGMYIVKQVVERLNGTIDLKSSYGEGSEIRIVLPNKPEVVH